MLSSLTNKPNVYSVWASQVAQWVKNLTTVQETQVIYSQIYTSCNSNKDFSISAYRNFGKDWLDAHKILFSFLPCK